MPLLAPRRQQDQRRQRRQPAGGDAEQVAVVQAGGEDHHHRQHHQERRRAEVRLQQRQADQAAEDHADRDHHGGHVVDLVHAPRQQVGEEQDERELGELGRLHADAADAEPPLAAVDLGRRDQHDQQADGDDAEPGPDHERLLVAAVVDLHRHRHQQEAGDDPRALLEQVADDVPVVLQRGRRRRARHHHGADAHEEQHGEKQPLVRSQRARHDVLLPATPKASAAVGRETPSLATTRPVDDPEPSATGPRRRSCGRTACVNGQQSSAPPRDGTPTSQARAACVPSGQLFIAAA